MCFTPQDQQSCLPPLFSPTEVPAQCWQLQVCNALWGLWAGLMAPSSSWKFFQSNSSKTTTGEIFAQQPAFLVGAKTLWGSLDLSLISAGSADVPQLRINQSSFLCTLACSAEEKAVYTRHPYILPLSVVGSRY